MEIPEELKNKTKELGKMLIDSDKRVKTVLKKAGPVSGEFRIRKVTYIAGKRNYIADYKENNCRFIFDVRSVFFSNRLSFERARIASLVSKEEDILVLFAGVGPFAIEIAKRSKKSNIIAIELNKEGYKWMKKNIELNKTTNVKAVYGDAKNAGIKYKNFADRIVMPMPKTSIDFLDSAFKASKKNAIIHIYTFCRNDELEITLNKIKEKAKKEGYKIKILYTRTVRAYSPKEIEIVVDFKITRL